MAVTVASDLSVNVSEDQNAKKLTDKQEILQESARKGEPKVMGVSQVMVGFLVISYSIPLLSTELTEVVKFGVPWWSGLTFVTAGSMALVIEKRSSMQLILACLTVTVVAAFISVLAMTIYVVDFLRNPIKSCKSDPETHNPSCDDLHYASMVSQEIKSILLCLNVVQTGISSAFSFMLYNEKKRLISYSCHCWIRNSPTSRNIQTILSNGQHPVTTDEGLENYQHKQTTDELLSLTLYPQSSTVQHTLSHHHHVSVTAELVN